MLTTGSTDLPVGIGFADTAHDFRVERCFMRHFQWKRRDNQYWNGGGFSTERGHARFLFCQCGAWDNSAGGFDLKSTESLLDDCTSGRNARNFRSGEHTPELQSLMRTSYGVCCLQKQIHT